MKEVFVFGAGASKASAGTPLGKDLVWSYYEDCSFHWFSKTTDGKYDLREDNKQFSNYGDFLKLAEKIYPGLSSTYEKFQRRNGSIYEPPDFIYEDKEYYVDEILYKLLKMGDNEGAELIRKLIFEHIIGKGFRSENELYKKFLMDFLYQKIHDDISIISFNFDFYLCEESNGYPYELTFDYLINFNSIDLARKWYKYNRGKVIPLIKLNGSFDWGFCRNCKKIFLYFPHMQWYYYYKTRCNICKGEVEPFIIIPHQEYPNIVETLWKKAEEKLNNADKITIIGYSFPDYDKEVIKLFTTSLNDFNNNVEMLVVDWFDSKNSKDNFNKHKSIIKNKYNNMFCNLTKEISYNFDGFEGYIKNQLSKNLP